MAIERLPVHLNEAPMPMADRQNATYVGAIIYIPGLKKFFRLQDFFYKYFSIMPLTLDFK
jgi:hypothetical protein